MCTQRLLWCFWHWYCQVHALRKTPNPAILWLDWLLLNFDALYAYNTVPATVGFPDLSTGTSPLTYAWEFGDGATSTERDPSHNYFRQGLYTVKLTATNHTGPAVKLKRTILRSVLPRERILPENPPRETLR